MWLLGGLQPLPMPFLCVTDKASPEVALEGVDENHFLWLSRNGTPIGTSTPCSLQTHRARQAPYLVTSGVFKDKSIWTYTLALAFSGCVAWRVYIDFSSPQCPYEMRSPQTVGRTRDSSHKGEFSARLFPLLSLHVTVHSALLSHVGCRGPRRACSSMRKVTRKQEIACCSGR